MCFKVTRRSPLFFVLALFAVLFDPSPARCDETRDERRITVESGTPAKAASSIRAARRARILEIAGRYAELEWTANARNVFHGEDPDGIRVDTPDGAFLKGGFATDGTINRGMAYQWGGFSTPPQFLAGLKRGFHAGHIPRGGGLKRSDRAVGIDCSGLVSRCWELPLKRSTRTLVELSVELPGYDALRPGDILNRFDHHVMLFKGFDDPERKRIRVIEAIRTGVTERVHPRKRLEKRGFKPLRYRPLSATWSPLPRPEAVFEGKDMPGTFEPDPEGEIGSSKPTGETESSKPAGTEDGPRSSIASRLPLEAGEAMKPPVRGDWSRYEATGTGFDTALRCGFAVSEADGETLRIRATRERNGQTEETERVRPAGRDLHETLLDVLLAGDPVRDIRVLSGSVSRGRYRVGKRSFLARRVKGRLAMKLRVRGRLFPLDVRFNLVVSPEAPYPGILEGMSFTMLEVDGRVSRRARTLKLEAFGVAPAPRRLRRD